MQVPSFLQNNIIVQFDKKFQEQLVSDGGLVLHQDTSFRPEWHTTVQGKVMSVPIKLTVGGGHDTVDPDRPRINPIVKPGDDLIFSYLVVMNRGQTDNAGDIFTQEKPRRLYETVWTNPNGLQIVRVYLQNNKYEIGLFDTVSRTWVDRIRGGEGDVEEFLGKYMPTQNVGFNYRNLFPYDGVDYWKVDYPQAIAIKRAEGVYDMVGDFVLLEPIREPDNKTYDGVLEIYNIEQSTDYK